MSRILLASLFTGTATVMMAAAASAQPEEREFNIPAGNLKSALDAYVRQSNRQVIYRSDDVRTARTKGVKGRQSLDAALEAILAGTGFQSTRDTSGAIAVVRATQAIFLPETDRVNRDLAIGRDDTDNEIIVTGTRLDRGSVAVPVNSYSAQAVQESGQNSLTGYLNTLPEVSVSRVPASSSAFGLQTTVQLRGLPRGTTLVMIDGKRPQTSGAAASYFNINSLPAAAVERIDIVPMGSSAIYGADAVAGVVNFILKKNFKGLEINVSGNWADTYDGFNASAVWGKDWGNAALTIAAAYDVNDPLFCRDRDLTRNQDFRRFSSVGGVDRRTTQCTPGTVTAVSGTLNVLGTTRAAIPAVGSPVSRPSDFAAGAGQQNLCSRLDETIISSTERYSGLLNGNLEIDDRLTIRSENLISRTTTSEPITNRIVSNALVPATNPYNPFGQPVRVSTELPYVSRRIFRTDFIRPLVGVRFDINKDWRIDASAHLAIERNQSQSGTTINTTRRTSALASTDPSTALNLFNPSSNNPALIKSLIDFESDTYETARYVADVAINGSFNLLPAGPVNFVVGGEISRETLDRFSSGQVVIGSREQLSAFLEARLPLIEWAGRERFAVSFAGRYDRYNDFGTALTPQFTAALVPWDGIEIGVAYSESFRAPPITFLSIPQSSAVVTLFDPVTARNNTFTVFFGGKPPLRPETGTARSINIRLEPGFLRGLSARLAYWEIDQDDRIVQPSFSTFVNNPSLFPGAIIRDPVSNNIVTWNSTFYNFGKLNVHGIDAQVSYRLDTEWGTFTPSVALVRTTKFASSIQPGSPPIDRLGRASNSDVWAPKYKLTAGMRFDSRVFSTGISGRYISDYLDYQDAVINQNRLGDHWTFDIFARFNLANLSRTETGDRKRGLTLNFAIVNLFDRQPRFSNFPSSSIGFDILQEDIIGRNMTATLSYRF